jgi:hypothetical protein
MPRYKIPIPQSRGLGDPEFEVQAISVSNNGFNSLLPEIRDVIIHAAICRIAYGDDHNHEFLTKYDPETNIIDIDIPDDDLDELTKITIGPKLEKYFSWLTNSLINLRRDTMQFTIGSNTFIATGQQGIGLTVGYDCVIERADLFLSTSASFEIELRAVPAGLYPGDASYSLGTIGVTGNTSVVDADISSWDKELNRGDLIVYNVNTSTAQLATVSLYVCRYSIFAN